MRTENAQTASQSEWNCVNLVVSNMEMVNKTYLDAVRIASLQYQLSLEDMAFLFFKKCFLSKLEGILWFRTSTDLPFV